MNKPVKQKLCWNCEGSVARTLENCPFCGVYLNPEEQNILKEHPAPYVPEAEAEPSIPEAPYTPVKEEVLPRPDASPINALSFSQAVLPVLFLTAGAISVLFSLLLLFFSVDGKLTLQWDADMWLYFALAALPLLFLGWRALEKTD